MLIKNAKVLTMEGRDIDGGDVLIENGKIKAVGTGLSGADKVIDAKGMYLSPGLIDAHCHIGLFNEAMRFEGADGNEAINPITGALRAIDSINPLDRCFEEARAAGVTGLCTGPGSANVIGGTFAMLKNRGRSVENMLMQTTVALKAAFGENPKFVYNGQKKTPTTRMAVAAVLRQALIDGQDYIARVERAEKEGKDPVKRDLNLENIAMVLRREIPLKVHAHRADDIMTAIRICKEFNIRFTLEHCTEGYMIPEELKASGAEGIILGPLFGNRSKVELRNKTYEAPRVLYENGIEFAMMTDHPVIPCEHLNVAASLAIKYGLPEEEALKSITINAAKILGVDGRIGSIKEGKDADLALYTHHPLDYRSVAKLVTIDGNIVYEG